MATFIHSEMQTAVGKSPLIMPSTGNAHVVSNIPSLLRFLTFTSLNETKRNSLLSRKGIGNGDQGNARPRTGTERYST